MKTPLLLLSAFGLGLILAVLVEQQRHAAQIEVQRSAWASEQARLELESNRRGAKRETVSRPSAESLRQASDATGPSAQSLLNELANLPVNEGDSRATRRMLAALEQLSRIGPQSLPAIRQFLATGSDVTYIPPGNKMRRNVKGLVNALVPASLRMGLFELLHQTGGKDAEAILVEALGRTRSGLEVAFVTQVLEEMASGDYKNEALAAAGRLLDDGAAGDRELLFEVMKRFGDTSYVATVQRQIIQSDGRVDGPALRYLQQSLGAQSMPFVSRYYQDARLSEPGSKEPLARAALTYVGASEQALDLFHTAVFDPSLLPDQKRNLVEDLNEDGLANRKNPTPEDLQIIANRYALTQSYLQQDYVRNDRLLNDAFREADKDLRNMLDRAATQATANPAK
ncbi:hypothetical protein [Haloferula sp. BvORR071]|uniref:hypothetical protein n=1 Tax=Haloferula sp. BvORR071 TaxID=1396141 RepID=UPI000556C96B|nr:hypothetical protein [Haloferula sp. BvORR071]